MKTRILIIGANSVLAREVLPVLSAENDITTAGRENCDIYCDVTKEVNIPKDIDLVVNFAAGLGGDTDKDISEALHTNVVGALNICMAAKESGVKHVVNISSIYASLGDEFLNRSIYGLTKKQGDELIKFYCNLNGISFTVLRPSRIYGPNDDFGKNQPFFYDLINKAQKGEDISLYGKNDARRNYIHSADVAEIIKRVVSMRVTGVYECTFPQDVTYSEIANAALKVFGKGGKVNFLDDKPDISNDSFGKETTLSEKIDYTSHISIEEGIESIRRYRERQSS